MILLNSEAVVRRCSVKKLLLEISQNSQENTCARTSFLIKLQLFSIHCCFPSFQLCRVLGEQPFSNIEEARTFQPATLLKKRLWHMCFPVNFAKFLTTSFFIKHLWWLLLLIYKSLTALKK